MRRKQAGGGWLVGEARMAPILPPFLKNWREKVQQADEDEEAKMG
ncbi:hypothetical protein RvVAR0630_29740 [Agrobacterium vitis]|nr:hypothetical protein RvVAR0630_29740 [Agrobacterium vitis]